jgi:PAS domain-containing protein
MIQPTGNGHTAARRAGTVPLTGTPSQRAVIEMTRTGIVSSWNPAAGLLYGYPAEEIVGHPADVLCPPEVRAGEAAVLRRITAGGRAERYEADRVRKDGTRGSTPSAAMPGSPGRSPS